MKKITLLIWILILMLINFLWAEKGVRFEQVSPDQIAVYVNGTHFTTWNFGEELNGVYLNKPVLWPVLTSKGTPITRDYPFRTDRIKERHDHPHHQGIFFTYGLLKYGEEDSINVWGISKPGELPGGFGKSAGRIICRENVEIQDGIESGVIHALCDWFSHAANKTFLKEDRTMIFGTGRNYRYIDFILRFKTLDQPVTWIDTKEGMFAIRVTPALQEKRGKNLASQNSRISPGNARYLNANGEELEQGVWGKRSPWVALRGILQTGEPLTIVIMDHVDNINHPTFWHARGYGLFSVNPFGMWDFTRKKHRFDFTLPVGGMLTLKYRMLFYEGELQKNVIENLYQDYVQ